MLARQLAHSQAECSSSISASHLHSAQIHYRTQASLRLQARHCCSVKASAAEEAESLTAVVSPVVSPNVDVLDRPSADLLLSLLRKKQRVQGRLRLGVTHISGCR